MCDRKKGVSERRVKREKKERWRGGLFIGLWVTQSTQWDEGDWQTGDLTFPRMLFMEPIMDLMLPWRPSIPASVSVALIVEESQDTDVRLKLCKLSAKAHMTRWNSLTCLIDGNVSIWRILWQRLYFALKHLVFYDSYNPCRENE